MVAIGRQLIVDLWRMETGRVTAQELNLVLFSVPNGYVRSRYRSGLITGRRPFRPDDQPGL